MDRAFESFGENPDRSDAFGAMIDIYVRLEEKLRGALPRLLRELEVTRRKDEGGGGGSGAGGRGCGVSVPALVLQYCSALCRRRQS